MFANSNADVEQAGSIQAPAKAEVEITAPTDIATAAATPQTMADAG